VKSINSKKQKAINPCEKKRAIAKLPNVRHILADALSS